MKMTSWEHFLRGVIPEKIDFDFFINELKEAKVIFLGDYHSELTPHSKNEKRILEDLIKFPDVFLGLEYHSEEKVASYHKPLIHVSRDNGKEPFFLAPNEKKGECWDFRKYEEHILKKIIEKINEGKKLVTVIGELHIRPGEKPLAGIPYLLNGNTITAIVYQDLLENFPAGIYKIEKDIPKKMIYNINGKID